MGAGAAASAAALALKLAVPAVPAPPAAAVLGLNCLLQYFQVADSVLPVQQRPSLVLSAEGELGITAGLQDRVIQVQEGGVECCCGVGVGDEDQGMS